MPPEINLLAFERGSVMAPAGCGKTQLIADTLAQHAGAKPVLILTHTNAGATALRARMARANIPSASYVIATLDGFTMKLISRFPARSGHDPAILRVESPRHDYPAIRAAALRLLSARHLDSVLRASYAYLLVDEYQDCNEPQHAIVTWLALVLRTYVLGDPMQAIFNFGQNRLVDWTIDVMPHFPPLGTLNIPWRWRRAGTEALGVWLLDVRTRLQLGQPVDLRAAPREVEWVQIVAATADAQRRGAALVRVQAGQGVLIIGNSVDTAGRQRLTSQTAGATIVESVDLPDLITFARSFVPTADQALNDLVQFAARMMTAVGAAAFMPRVEIIRNGRNRTAPTPAEQCAVTFLNAQTYSSAAELLQCFSKQQGAHVYRPEVLRCSLAALRAAETGALTLPAAAVQIRERNRLLGRPLSRRAVGSTLLLKGLEADVVVILQPEEMNAKNLYVALTRGAKRVLVCSDTPILQRPAI
ncbi:UvrD-helicase domain-containing protein [Pseudomonas sp. S2_H01]